MRDHFAILKVGPALTFALREAIWALDQVEREWLGEEHSSQVRGTILAAMRSDPSHWRKYYHETGHALELQLQYSLSDRIRYYWPTSAVSRALTHLESSLEAAPPPPSLLHQYLPAAVGSLRRAGRPLSARNLLLDHVRQVLADYSSACRTEEAPA